MGWFGIDDLLLRELMKGIKLEVREADNKLRAFKVNKNKSKAVLQQIRDKFKEKLMAQIGAYNKRVKANIDLS